MRRIPGFLSGFLTAALIIALCFPAFASTVRQLNANYSGIKITLDGAEIVPTDANGATVEPFTVDGTTYLPVRAIANALGLVVEWDGATQTVKLSSSPEIQGNVSLSTNEVILQNGNYVSGTDFPAGTYDIFAISGSGNVFSSNAYEGGINAMMGIEDNPTFSEYWSTEYQNVYLPEGTSLQVIGSMGTLEIKLVPS